MNDETEIKETVQSVKQKKEPNSVFGWQGRTAVVGIALAVGVGVLIYSALADVPQPVLRIASLGSNQFSITITNGANTNYTLFWKPVLNPSYPWQVLTNNEAGDTNFAVDVGTLPVGFFRVMVGIDADGDGIPDWQDANPADPATGILSLTIDSPLNGAVVQ